MISNTSPFFQTHSPYVGFSDQCSLDQPEKLEFLRNLLPFLFNPIFPKTDNEIERSIEQVNASILTPEYDKGNQEHFFHVIKIISISLLVLTIISSSSSNTITNCKKLKIGILASLPSVLFISSLKRVADKLELMEKISHSDVNMSVERIYNATGGGFGITVFAPIIEEVFLRYLLQDLILKKSINFLFSPTNSIIDEKTRKIGRVALSALTFSLCHLTNTGVATDSYLKHQLFATFILGTISGMIKEHPNLGLRGSIGVHIGNNLIAMLSYWAKAAK